MTYNPNIPQGNDSPANQQAGIQTNFAQFASVFAINHTAFNGTNSGNHEGIILTNQTLDPGTTDNNAVLYSKNAAAATGGPQPQLFLQVPKFLPTARDPSDIGSLPMQLTYNTVNTAGPVYQSFLPGGYIFYFGNVTTSSTTNLITLSPVPTKILMAIAEANSVLTTGAGLLLSTNILTASTFNVLVGGSLPASYSFSWMAIASA